MSSYEKIPMTKNRKYRLIVLGVFLVTLLASSIYSVIIYLDIVKIDDELSKDPGSLVLPGTADYFKYKVHSLVRELRSEFISGFIVSALSAILIIFLAFKDNKVVYVLSIIYATIGAMALIYLTYSIFDIPRQKSVIQEALDAKVGYEDLFKLGLKAADFSYISLACNYVTCASLVIILVLRDKNVGTFVKPTRNVIVHNMYEEESTDLI